MQVMDKKIDIGLAPYSTVISIDDNKFKLLEDEVEDGGIILS